MNNENLFVALVFLGSFKVCFLSKLQFLLQKSEFFCLKFHIFSSLTLYF